MGGGGWGGGQNGGEREQKCVGGVCIFLDINRQYKFNPFAIRLCGAWGRGWVGGGNKILETANDLKKREAHNTLLL